MVQHLALEVGLHVIRERHVFCVAQAGIGLGLAIGLADRVALENVVHRWCEGLDIVAHLLFKQYRLQVAENSSCIAC
jgi:hypothetical protein